MSPEPASPESANSEPTARKQVQAIARGGEAVAIDGALDEPIWQQAPVAAGFIERDPVPGRPASTNMEFRVLYDDAALYFGVKAQLAPGKRKPRVLVLARDSGRIWYDNVIVIKVDPTADRRTSIEFAINAAGTQIDQLSLENGKVVRAEFDALWQAEARIGDGEWSAEFRIPYVALGMPAVKGPHTVGLNLTITDAPAAYNWSEIPPQFAYEEARLYGDIVGVRDTAGGRPVSFIPYLTMSTPDQLSDVDFQVGDDTAGFKGGIDIRTRLGPDLWVEATALTDFAQADLDDQVVNLDRFPLFLPEKRPFFLSGLDVFEFGIPGRVQPFFSRRIGLDANDVRIPVWGGLKVYGHSGRVAFGFLDMVTDDAPGVPLSNVAVGRVRANITDSAHVGVLATAKHGRALVAGDDGVASYFMGADAAARTLDGRLDVSAFGGVTRSSELPSGDDVGYFAGTRAGWIGSTLTPSLSFVAVAPEFTPDVGFVQRQDFMEWSANVPATLRYSSGPVRELIPALSASYLVSLDNRDFLGLQAAPSLALHMRNSTQVTVSGKYADDVVVDDFELLPGVIIPADRYEGVSGRVELGTFYPRLPVFTVGYEANSNFFGGTLHNVFGWTSGLFITRHVELSGSLSWSRIDLPASGVHHALVANGLASLRPTRDVVLDLVLQRNNLTEVTAGMVRLRWRYMPGSDLFLVYQENTNASPDARSVTLKATFRYDALL